MQLEDLGERILVRYCRTTVREFDLMQERSLPLDIELRDFVWPPSSHHGNNSRSLRG